MGMKSVLMQALWMMTVSDFIGFDAFNLTEERTSESSKMQKKNKTICFHFVQEKYCEITVK